MFEDDTVELKIGDLNERTLSRESLNPMIDCWLPLIILQLHQGVLQIGCGRPRMEELASEYLHRPERLPPHFR